MSTPRVLRAAGRVANMPFVAVLLSAVYPAVFLLSLNWYALRAEKMAFVILTPAAVAVTSYLFVRIAVWSLFTCVRALGGSANAPSGRSREFLTGRSWV